MSGLFMKMAMRNRSLLCILSVLIFWGVVFLQQLPAQTHQGRPLTLQELEYILAEIDSARWKLPFTGILQIQRVGLPRPLKVRVWAKPPFLMRFYPVCVPDEPRGIRELEKRMRNRRRPRFSSRQVRDEFYGLTPRSKYLNLLGKNYELVKKTGNVVAGIPTITVLLKPRFLPRFGIRFHYDPERYFVLKREILFFRPERPPKRVINLEFEIIQFNPLFPDSLQELIEKRKKGYEGRRRRYQDREARIANFDSLEELVDSIRTTIYVPEKLPEGFELVRISLSRRHGYYVVHLHYTDGLLGISLFQFVDFFPRFLKRYERRQKEKRESPYYFRQFYATRKGKNGFLFIGNVDSRMLRRIGRSLKPLR
jgi:hypothetical protein